MDGKDEAFTKEARQRICEHMNKDHNDSILKYAKNFGCFENPENVKMLSIDEEKMVLDVDGKILDISFDHTILNSTDARKTLISMLN